MQTVLDEVMREIRPLRSYGPGIHESDVLRTRSDASNPLRLPSLDEIAPYHVATAERASADAPVQIRLWMNERDAAAYLARMSTEGRLFAGEIFAILPSLESTQPTRSSDGSGRR